MDDYRPSNFSLAFKQSVSNSAQNCTEVGERSTFTLKCKLVVQDTQGTKHHKLFGTLAQGLSDTLRNPDNMQVSWVLIS